MTGNETILRAINEGDIVKAKEYLEANVREETAKKSGAKTSDITIIKGIMKNLLKTNHRAEQGYFPIDFDGEDYCGFTDCHRILASKMDFGYKEMTNPFKANEIFKPFTFGKFNNAECIEVDREKAKIFAKLQKSKGRYMTKVPYIIETDRGYIGMNPDYLLNMLDFVETDKFYFLNNDELYRGDFNYYISTLFAINEEDKRFGMILPMSIGDGDAGIMALKENGFNMDSDVEDEIEKEA